MRENGDTEQWDVVGYARLHTYGVSLGMTVGGVSLRENGDTEQWDVVGYARLHTCGVSLGMTAGGVSLRENGYTERWDVVGYARLHACGVSFGMTAGGCHCEKTVIPTEVGYPPSGVYLPNEVRRVPLGDSHVTVSVVPQNDKGRGDKRKSRGISPSASCRLFGFKPCKLTQRQ